MKIRIAATAFAALLFTLVGAAAHAAEEGPPAHSAVPGDVASATGAASAADPSLPQMLAAGRGPIDWQYDDETRTAMENDMELFRLYNLAKAAKNRRKTIGLATFIPGAIFTAVGFLGGLFQDAIGLYDVKTGEWLLVGGVTSGLTLVGVGIGFSAIESQAEKDYKAYIKEKYHVYPILQITPTKHGAMANLGVGF